MCEDNAEWGSVKKYKVGNKKGVLKCSRKSGIGTSLFVGVIL